MELARGHEQALEEQRGGGRTCPAEVAELLLAHKDMWAVSDMPVVATADKDVKDVMEMWESIFEDAKEGAISVAVSNRFKLWVKAAVDAPPPPRKVVDVVDDVHGDDVVLVPSTEVPWEETGRAAAWEKGGAFLISR